MMIRVKFHDGRTEIVPQELLQDLIEQRQITEFQRSDGWASVGIDPIRSMIRAGYDGPERRRNL